MLDRLNALLLSLVLVLGQVAPSLASQNALLSPTTGTVSGLQLTNNYNSALDSLNTANSGATAPTNQLTGSASLGNWWLNLTSAPYPLGMYDGNQWPALASLDPSAHAWNVQIGGGAATLASASTVDLCSTPRNYITISGTVTVTSFGSTCAAGVAKLITFSGVTQVTYNATSLIIPGAANIPATAAGDQALAVSLGSGNWQIAMYQPASGGALINPAVDLGTMLMTFAIAPPSSKYLFSYGQTISRTTYAGFLAISTITQSVTRTSGSPTLTGFTDTTQIPTNAPIEGSGIPTADTIVSCTSTTCLMAVNATSSGTANVTIFPNGNGDGSNTFNLPNCQGAVLAGRPNMSGTPRGNLASTYFGTNPNALGAYGGTQSQTLITANLPPYTPSGSISASGSVAITQVGPFLGGSGGLNLLEFGGSTGVSVSATFSGTAAAGQVSAPFAVVQPTLTANCMIRVLAMRDVPQSAHFASNDNALPIFDRRRSVA